MLKLSRDHGLYKYLDFAFKLFGHYHRQDEYWHKTRGLEQSDFCRIVRVGLIYVPLIVVSQFVFVTSLFLVCVVSPLINTPNIVSMLAPIGSLAGFVFVVTGLVGLILWLLTASSDRRELKYQAALRLYYDGKGPHPADKPKKTPVREFFKAVYLSVKDRFCPIIKFEDSNEKV